MVGGKAMKKILSILSAAAVLFGAVSCAKDNLGQIKEVKTVDNPLNTILVKVASDTKLAVDSDNLTPAFEEGDEIFGWDSEGTTYAYTCTEVTEDAATFTRTSSGAPSADEGTVVNLVYAPGYEIEDIVDKTLDVNLAVQGETLPVIMHISGTVDEEGICKVTFLNDVAIVDVKDAVLPDAVEDEEYTVSFHGKNTSLKFTLDEDGSLVVAPAVEGPISSSEKAKVSADSKISKKFAVPASLEATDVIIAAMAADGSTYTFSAGSKEIAAGKYIKVTGKEFAPQYVAQISSDKYMTLAKAVAVANAAEDVTTVKLLEDATIFETLKINNEAKKEIILDIDGKNCICSDNTIKMFDAATPFTVKDDTKSGSIKGGFCCIHSSSTLTLSDVQFEATGKSASAVINTNGENTVLNMTNCSVEATSETSSDAIRAVNAEGLATIDGCTLTSNGYALRLYAQNVAESSSMTVRNTYCYANGSMEAINTSNNTGKTSKITIESGYFHVTDAENIAKTKSSDQLEITGGHYNREVVAASGYVCLDKGESEPYRYVVEKATGEVLFVETGIQCALTDAIAAANAYPGACTIKFLKDLTNTASKTITNVSGVTFDMNGKTLTIKSSNRIAPKEGGKLIIDGDGVVTNTTFASNVFVLEGGTLIIKKTKVSLPEKPEGSSSSSTSAISVKDGGHLYVEGGEISVVEAAPTVAVTGNNATCEITGGTITGSGTKNGVLRVNNASASVSIDGVDVIVSSKSNSVGSPSVFVEKGSFELKNGTVGSTNEYTAIKVKDGSCKISGGSVVSQRQSFYCAGLGQITILDGEIRNTKGGTNYCNFYYPASSEDYPSPQNSIEISGGYIFTNTSATYANQSLFYDAGNDPKYGCVPSSASVTITGGYFTRDINSFSFVNMNGKVCSSGTFTHNGRTYKYHVE